MPGKQIEHVIKKWQPSTDAGLATTIEVELHTHIGLFGFTLDLRDSRCGLRQMVFGFFHKSLPHWNGVSTGSGSSDRIQAQSVDPEINPVATAPGTDLIQSGALRLPPRSKYFPQRLKQKIVLLRRTHAETKVFTQHRIATNVANQNISVK